MYSLIEVQAYRVIGPDVCIEHTFHEAMRPQGFDDIALFYVNE
jgi:hypothetical protein